MRNAPKIIIIGQAGSGKSSLARLIRSLLIEKGFNSSIDDEDNSDEEYVSQTWRKRVKSLDGKLIEIKTLRAIQ